MTPTVSARAHFSFIMVSDYHNAVPITKMMTKMALIKRLQARKKFVGENAESISEYIDIFFTSFLYISVSFHHSILISVDS